jgi:hypothetical protein
MAISEEKLNKITEEYQLDLSKNMIYYINDNTRKDNVLYCNFDILKNVLRKFEIIVRKEVIKDISAKHKTVNHNVKRK